MKRVLKGTEPASFIDWKATANDNWRPTYPTLQNPQKRELHEALLLEQGFFCCYCGREIEASTSHIEHFRPQEAFEAMALDYQNLHASCLRETLPGNPLHCGHRKGNWFDEVQHISPMDEDCELRFRYLLTGEIQPTNAEDLPAAKMIEMLALDIAYLNNRRQNAIGGVFDDEFLLSVSDDDLNRLIAVIRSTDIADQHAFDHIIARYAEQRLSR